MELANNTINQHYISQVELKNNRIIRDNGFETDLIYQFKIKDRDTNQLELTNDKGIKINKTLSFNDLFTFSYSKEQRENLEQLFSDYETKTSELTENIKYIIEHEKAKTSELGTIIYDIFCLKFLNFIRNPNNILKSLNTMGNNLKYYINNPKFLSYYTKIDSLSDEKCQRICKTFDIKPDIYRSWIKMLLLLLYPTGKGKNIMENIIESMIYNTNMATGVLVNYITDNKNSFLVSDRGCLFGDSNNKEFVLYFNLTSQIFISYGFMTPDFSKYSKEVVELYNKRPKNITVHLIENDYEDIKHKNMLTIFQGKEFVYSATKNILV